MRCLLAVFISATALGHASRHLHNEVAAEKHADSSSANADEAMEHGILTSSMQDYLNQISQLEINRNPSIAVPGEWLTDAHKSFIFLPIRIPKTLPLNEMKMLTDGRSLLVNVVERPAQAPEDQATKKFRFILDNFKEQTAGNEQALTEKLGEWLSDEDNMKVKDLIQETLATMNVVDHHDRQAVPRSLTIPLNTLELGAVREKIAAAHHTEAKAVKKEEHKTAEGIRIANPHGGTASIRLRSTYLQQDSKITGSGDTDGSGFGSSEPNLITIPLDAQFLQKLVTNADYVVPLNDNDAFAALRGTPDKKAADKDSDSAYIKESFSVRLPYPIVPSRIFAVMQSADQIVICMPFVKGNKATSSPFIRVPVFDMDGKKLLGQGANQEPPLDPETSEHKKKVVVLKATQAKVSAPAKPAEPKKLIAIGL